MFRWLLLFAGVLAAVVSLERYRIAAYAPEPLAALLQTSPPQELAAGSARSRGGGAPVTVEVARAEAGSLPVLRDTIGMIVPVASTVMTSETTGTVASLAVADGAAVRRGDLLLSLDDRAIQAQIDKDQAAVDRDQVTLDQARRDLSRAQDLVKTGAFTAQQGEDAASAAETAAAVVAVDQAALAADRVALDKLRIVAPFDGRLGAFQVSVGALVTPGTEMVRLTQVSPVYAAFTLPQEDLPLIQESSAAGTLSVSLLPAGDGASPLEGRVAFIDNSVDAASGSIALRARIDNPDARLVAGQSISVTVKAGERDGLVLVPTVAVQPHQDGSTVYVVTQDGKAAIRKVDVALEVGDRTGLSGGVQAGDRVVVEGQGGLTDGAGVRVEADPGKPAPVAAAEGKAATP